MTDTLTLLIQCPCGYYDEIPGVRPDDPAHARYLARSNGWVKPRINAAPLDAAGRITAKGQCRECYILYFEG